jgi:hypothetical protein
MFKRIIDWFRLQRNRKQQEMADIDTMLYGVGFIRIDSTGRMTRIDPTELYSKSNPLSQTYDNPLVDSGEALHNGFPHLDTCKLKNGGSNCSCGLN